MHNAFRWFIGLVLYVIIASFALSAILAPGVEQPKPVTVYDVARGYDAQTRFELPELGETFDERSKWSLLRDVIACESASQWVVVEVPGRGMDLGPCQISTYWHAGPAARKGYDIFVPSQNVLYCIDLFNQYYPAMTSGSGWNPWKHSQACWQDRQRIRKEQAKL